MASMLRPAGESSFIANGFWAVGDQAVVSLSSFVTTIIIGRFCTPEELGIYALVLSSFWLIAGFPNALIWVPYTSRVPSLSKSRQARYAGSALLHIGVIFVFLVGLLVVAAFSLPAVASHYGLQLLAEGQLTQVCLAMVPFSGMMLLREHYRRHQTAQLRMRELMWVDLPIGVTQTILLCLLAMYDKLSVVSALWVTSISCLYVIVALMIQRSQFSLQKRTAIQHFSYNFRFGRWLLFGTIAWLLSENFFRWSVVSFYGLSTLGQMAAALYIVMLFNPLLVSISYYLRAVMANRLSEQGIAYLSRFALTATACMAVAFGLMFGILALFGESVVLALYGESYGGQGFVVAAFCLAMFFQAIAAPIDAALMALWGGKELAMASGLQLFIAIAAGIPLIYFFGPVGVGLTMALSGSGAFLMRWRLFCRTSGYNLGGPKVGLLPEGGQI